MFRIIVVPAVSSANVVLFYKTESTADIAQKNIHKMMQQEDRIMVVKDDFGHVLTMSVKSVAYSLFVDPDKLDLAGTSPARPGKPNGAANPGIIL